MRSMRNAPLSRQVRGLGVAVCLVLVGAVVPLAVSIVSLRDAQSRSSTAQRVSDQLVNTRSSMLEVEAALHGYLLTGDESLAPLRPAYAALRGRSDTLMALVYRSPRDLVLAQRIDSGINAYLDRHVGPLIRVRDRGRLSARQLVAEARDGRARLDSLRDLLVKVYSDEAAAATQGTHDADSAASRALIFAAIGTAAIMLLLLGLGMHVTRQVVWPLRRLADAARRLALGDLDVRLVEHGPAEVLVATDSFNTMARSLHEAQLELRASNEELAERVATRTRELDEARIEAFQKLALAAEDRDDETRQHTHRVGRTSALLAEAMGLDAELVATLRQVAPLHDIGKIGIPDAILLKPGRLTAVEYKQMQRHAAIGAHILGRTRSPLLDTAAEVALNHHERWEGGGYPRGIAGADIPLVGRIVAVADVFDALSHARPYKEAWPLEDAVREITESSGTHFDPDVVAAFERLDHASLLTDVAPDNESVLIG